MRPKGVKGYHGYKWKDKYDMVELLVFTFEGMGLNFDKKIKSFFSGSRS